MTTFKHTVRPALTVLAASVLAAASACNVVQDIQQPQPPVRPSDGLFDGLLTGRTMVIDLTHPLDADNPYWPGEGYGPFEYEIFATLEDDGVLSGRFAMAEHTGTHLDAPNHFVEGQIALDELPLEQLVVRAAVIDVRERVAEDADYQLTADDVLSWERSNGRIAPNTLVFMYTGWDERWNDFSSYRNEDDAGTMHFPGFSAEAATLLSEERDAAGLGIDTLSVDHGMSTGFEVHAISHGRAKYHIENAANLGELPATGAWAVVAPIKIRGGTGGPARILALVDSAAAGF